eukprot:UN07116
MSDLLKHIQAEWGKCEEESNKTSEIVLETLRVARKRRDEHAVIMRDVWSTFNHDASEIDPLVRALLNNNSAIKPSISPTNPTRKPKPKRTRSINDDGHRLHKKRKLNNKKKIQHNHRKRTRTAVSLNNEVDDDDDDICEKRRKRRRLNNNNNDNNKIIDPE